MAGLFFWIHQQSFFIQYLFIFLSTFLEMSSKFFHLNPIASARWYTSCYRIIVITASAKVIAKRLHTTDDWLDKTFVGITV